MVPSDYRLDAVTARLIERLEGARPTWSDPEQAGSAFREIAEKFVDAALAEFAELSPAEDPGPHAEFLRRELLGTALPRYTRLAVDMTRTEGSGFGFGPLAEPAGRLVLVVVSLLVAWWGLLRFVGQAWDWPLLLLDLSLPLWPTIAQVLHTRRYRARLEAIVGDMARIQDSERTFLNRAELDAAREVTGAAQRRPRREVEP